MKTLRQLREVKKSTGKLKDACWSGYTAVGTKQKGGRTVPNCVPEEVEQIDEISQATVASYKGKAEKSAKEMEPWTKKGEYKGLAKAALTRRNKGIERAKSRLGEETELTEKKDEMEYSDPYMAANQLRTIMHNAQEMIELIGEETDLPEWVESKITLAEDYIMTVANYMRSELHEDANPENMFDIVEEMVMQIAETNDVDSEVIWEDFETISDEELYEVAAWQRKEGKSKSGGLNRKGIMSYRRENPGSKLSMAVTTKPSKLKKGSKAAKRRKSFCARMGGMKKRLTSAKTSRDPDSRINKALRKWNC
jgi:hypothetical protein